MAAALDFLHAYPYFAGCMLVVAICAVGFGLCPRPLRRSMLVNGLLMTPFALASALVVPEYWNPTRVAVLVTGVEDVVFSFGSGAIAWLVAVWSVRDRLSIESDRWRGVRRYFFSAAAGLVIGGLCRLVGARPMTAIVVSFAAIAAFIMTRRKANWPLFAAGFTVFPVGYVTFAKALFVVFPHFLAQWNQAAFWGPQVFGVPLEEVVWAFAFGSVWPLFAAYVLGARVESRAAVRPRAG